MFGTTKNSRSLSFFLLAVVTIPTRPPDVIIKGFHLEETKSLKKSLKIDAPQAEQFKKEQLMRAISPHSFFFQENGKAIQLDSAEALADLQTRDVYFKGATEIISPEGLSVSGHDLNYSNKERKIETDQSVKFESTADLKSAYIQGWGTGFEADLAQKTFYIPKDFNLSFIAKDAAAAPSKIRGNSARVFPEKGWAQVDGNVAFQNKDLSLRSDFLSINFDAKGERKSEEATFQSYSKSHVVALFDNYKLSSKEVILTMENRKTISRIEARGEVILTDDQGLEATTENLKVENPQAKSRTINLVGKVYIKRGPDEAKCQDAFIDPESDNWLLKGDASFQRGKDILAGQEIHYSKSKNILEIKRASGQLQKSRVIPPKKN